MQKLARFLLRLFGWELKVAPPPSRKYVLIGAPHTSNWDFVVGLLALWGARIRARWLGKKELFKPPLGHLMRALGGIPVDRSRREGLVDQVAEIFRREEEIAILITPEGTRGKAPYWRTGFYYMALKAGVPIAPLAGRVLMSGEILTVVARWWEIVLPSLADEQVRHCDLC